MKGALATTLLATIALAAAPCALLAQTEPAPAPSASAAPLPEIGRTRATPAACAVMRDIVVPAVAAAQRADAKFGELESMLPVFLQLRSDYFGQRTETKTDGVFLEAQFSHLDVGLTALLQQLERIRKLLDDPRMTSSADPAVVAERAQLERLYAAQQARARLTYAFLQRQAAFLNKHLVGWEDPVAIHKINQPKRPEDAWTGRAPVTSAPPGMPVLTGAVAEDKSRMREWTSGLTTFVEVNEDATARAFAPLEQSCR
jgi:hypothetical protein